MSSERHPNSDRFPETLEARLRALPQPPVPAGLETRLLAAIPVEMPFVQRYWAVCVRVAGALAAACLVALLAWPRGDTKAPVPRPGTSDSAHQAKPRPPREHDPVATRLLAGRDLDGAGTPTFTWPLEERSPMRVSTSISADLLD